MRANAPNPATAITLVDAVLECIARDRFLSLLRTDSVFAMRVHEANSREIVEQANSLGALACIPARFRLERFLRQIARSRQEQLCLSDGRLRLPLKRKDLAALLAIRPEHLSRTLHEMSIDGTITLKGEWIVLHRKRTGAFDVDQVRH